MPKRCGSSGMRWILNANGAGEAPRGAPPAVFAYVDGTSAGQSIEPVCPGFYCADNAAVSASQPLAGLLAFRIFKISSRAAFMSATNPLSACSRAKVAAAMVRPASISLCQCALQMTRLRPNAKPRARSSFERSGLISANASAQPHPTAGVNGRRRYQPAGCQRRSFLRLQTPQALDENAHLPRGLDVAAALRDLHALGPGSLGIIEATENA